MPEKWLCWAGGARVRCGCLERAGSHLGARALPPAGAAVPSLGKLLDHLAIERRKVAGFSRRHDPAVDDNVLVHPVGAGVPQVGSDRCSGSQWWWRVRYSLRDRPPIDLANEIHLPAGRRINTRLVSADVVHSFWIPAIAGKMDMIPGRINRLALEPTRVGTFRGACAEYCGTSHARMNLIAVVSDQQTFDGWLANQERSSRWWRRSWRGAWPGAAWIRFVGDRRCSRLFRRR